MVGCATILGNVTAQVERHVLIVNSQVQVEATYPGVRARLKQIALIYGDLIPLEPLYLKTVLHGKQMVTVQSN